MRRLLLLLTGLLVAACGGATAPVIDTSSHDPILVVTDEGGFAPVVDILGRVPRYVLLADGTIFSQGAVPAIHPAPLLTPVITSTIGDADMTRVLELVGELGLPEADHIVDDTRTNVADASTTVVTWLDPAGEHRLSVYALGITRNDSDLAATTAQLVETLDRAAATATDSREWTPDRLEIRAGDLLDTDPAFVDLRPWPFPFAPGDMPEVQAGWRCVTLEGTEVATVLDAVRSANRATEWEHAEGGSIPLVIKPLLPGQTGCA